MPLGTLLSVVLLQLCLDVSSTAGVVALLQRSIVVLLCCYIIFIITNGRSLTLSITLQIKNYRDRQVWKLTPRTASKVNAFKAWVASGDAMAEQYKKAPAPLDFKDAKGKLRDKEFVESLEKFYKTASPPPEVYEAPEGAAEERAKYLEMFKESEAFDQELKVAVKAELEFMKQNRTTKDTTIHDFKMNYPAIHEEIEDEIEAREWFKNTGMQSK